MACKSNMAVGGAGSGRSDRARVELQISIERRAALFDRSHRAAYRGECRASSTSKCAFSIIDFEKFFRFFFDAPRAGRGHLCQMKDAIDGSSVAS